MVADSKAIIDATTIAAERLQHRRTLSILRLLLRKPLGFAGGLLILAMILVAIFADSIATYDPLQSHVSQRLAAPNSVYILGTDNFGRDIFSRLVHGSRISLWVGIMAVCFSTVAGTTIGIFSGHYGGRLDLFIQRVMDSLMAFPAIILALAIIAAVGPSLTNVILAIGIVQIPGLSRVVRATTLSVEENQYVEAARTIG
ncbi:MAG: ABC transporter permease, partial [Candidatus Marsarchaeota archaeon]|nr:ABC transporter permease [Candidatus Marsarchaeota archaeon]